ncbi:hypothetical protein QQF64_004148 [Cirrhinus molitorella]|uniref:TRIM8/14/16/25/29/45/65 coiled-coil region domain-containing protein n=1 Tax=Cirrhinus molitorella TaxID=172907 RepID=A0ABR3MJB3_9TELE
MAILVDGHLLMNGGVQTSLEGHEQRSIVPSTAGCESAEVNSELMYRPQAQEFMKQLKKTQKTFQQRIQQREKDVQQLREAVESHKRSAQTAVEDSERIFTELIRSIERSRSELIRLIRDQEKAAVSRAEGRLERLEQEINDLRRRDAELEQLSHTQDHIQFLQQLRETVESHKRSAQTAVEDSERIFTELIRSIERSRSELIRLIRDQEKAAVSRAEGRLERLEQEINDLRRRDAELEQLSHTQDHIQFLQSLSAPPESTDVNEDLFSSFFSFDVLRESVHQLRDKLEDFCKEELKKISDRVTFTNIVPRTRKDFLQYSRQLTLDLNTAHKCLSLSENNRLVVSVVILNDGMEAHARAASLPWGHHSNYSLSAVALEFRC